MNIILPVTPADQRLFLPLAKLLLYFFRTAPGPWAEGAHKLALLVSPRVTWTSGETETLELIQAILPEGTVTIDRISTDLDVEKGWPMSPNLVFMAAVRHSVGLVSEGKPWYFFELDNTPLKPSWADMLERAYGLAQEQYGARFLGVINETRGIFPGIQGENKGKHLVGTSIYPADFFRFSKLTKHLPNTQLPFDVFLQWEVVKQSRETALIQHNWMTKNYRRDQSGNIVCDPDRHADNPNYARYAQPVKDAAVVVHGCKDGSLAQLVLAEACEGQSVDTTPAKFRAAVEPKKSRRTGRVLAEADDADDA